MPSSTRRLRSQLGQTGNTPGSPDDETRALNHLFAVLTLDVQGRVLSANSQFLDSYGFDLEDLKGQDFRTFSPDVAQDAPSIGRAWAAVLAGQPQSFYRMRKSRDGTEHWVHASYSPLSNREGAVERIVEISRNVSDAMQQVADDRGQVEAINTSQAVVQFALDGSILHANALFLSAMGYRLDEVLGRHHRMFVDAAEAASEQYAGFWHSLARGEHQSAEFRRVGKGGRDVWLRATYNPIFDAAGRPQKIVKYATDVALEKLERADFQWQIDAIRKSHCVISFDLHGIVLEANERFLDAAGYAEEEVIGRHHRMFVEPSYAHSAEYASFWRRLGAGQPQSGEFQRVGKGGREIWLNANYSPVFDTNGNLVKIVKYAQVVTDEKRRQADQQGQIAAIHKSLLVVSFDLNGLITDANENFLDLTGYRLAEVRGQHHRMFVEPFVAEDPAYQAFWASLANGAFQAAEFKRITKDGREIWLQATYNPIMDSKGRPTKVVKYATDVTQEKLRQADYFSQVEAINKSQGVITLAVDGTIIDANANMLQILGYSLGELRGKHHSFLIEPGQEHGKDYIAFWDTLRAGRFVAGRHQRIGKNGRRLWLQASYNPVFDLNGDLCRIVKFATDITSDVAMAKAYDDARRQAQHDPATSLPNRMRLAAFMATALSQPAARMAVLYLDLDRFKPVNDTYGHLVGDKVLAAVADRLRRSLGGDHIAARVGGDEFVIAAPNMNEEEVEAYCNQLQLAISEPIRHEGGDLRIGVSIGVAMSPDDGVTPDDLLRAADTALYRSKRHGRATHSFFAAEMNERIHASRRLMEELRRGIAREEFFLEYQPRFDAKTQEVRSAEALVRWAHPEKGRMAPDGFIGLAEKSGLIVPLGDWVLRTACQMAATWPNDVGVSVNISPVQFREPNFVVQVQDILKGAALQPSRLEIELTEGVFVEDAERAGASLRQLKALGVKLAIDDFGTGYSSLGYLRNFPFDVIKIDRQFISDLTEKEGTREIVKAVLALGKALGMEVTAEGVETDGQLQCLVEDNCAEVQGFLLARPMGASMLEDFLARSPTAVHG